MKKTISIFLFIICLFSQTTHAQYSVWSGNSWMKICNIPSYLGTTETVLRETICESYTQGIIEAWLTSSMLFKQDELFCINQTHSTKQHILVIQNFMEKNPSKLHNTAALLIFDAMLQAFPPPCNPK